MLRFNAKNVINIHYEGVKGKQGNQFYKISSIKKAIFTSSDNSLI